MSVPTDQPARATVIDDGEGQIVVFPEGFLLLTDEVEIRACGRDIILREIQPSAAPRTEAADEAAAFTKSTIQND
jgi:virulence-associated protein VagC